MKISEDTLDILKNFATINGNIVISEGSTVRTVSESKTIMASADVEETFSNKFGIYDLNDFLSWLNLTRGRDADFDFGETSITATNGSGLRTTYEYADTSILTTPKNDIVMPEGEVEFNLTGKEIAEIQQAAGVLGLDEVAVHNDDGKIRLTINAGDGSTDNSYSIILSDENAVINNDGNDFSIVFNIKNLRMMGGDYKVTLSSKLISQFENTESNVKYWIAIQKNSRFE